LTRAGTRGRTWQNGVMTDLNTLIPAASPLFLLFATAINSHGEIAGFGVQKSTGDVQARRKRCAVSQGCSSKVDGAATV
jgi:hypothetical protein